MVDLGSKSDCIMVTTFEAESSEDIVTQVMPAKLLEVGTAAFKDRYPIFSKGIFIHC